ncbi:MAG TPA: VTT domain-containing protein [Kineosporiaceae bacterium]|jgi:membrane protein DedA with SNARE-associated domain|nr:VTT domain-containing protein [Kineosporiaceae bacterium]
MTQAAAGATSGTASAFGIPAVFALLLCCETGLPVPLPADVLMLALGGAVSAGTIPWWLAALGLELVAVVGTALLLFLARGPATALLARLGPRVGLTADRMRRSSSLVERRGWPALLTGRTTPGLRTITVVAAAASTVPARRALPALVAGSTIFLQVHLALGLALGAPVRALLASAGGRTLLALAVVAAVGLAIAVGRARRQRVGGHAWTDGVCPACSTLTYLAPLDRADDGG